jgi:hypothetical protein
LVMRETEGVGAEMEYSSLGVGVAAGEEFTPRATVGDKLNMLRGHEPCERGHGAGGSVRNRWCGNCIDQTKNERSHVVRQEEGERAFRGNPDARQVWRQHASS